MFHSDILKPTREATSNIYVEGLPQDATDREVAHIFRPYPGYKSVKTEARYVQEGTSHRVTICIAHFENASQAMVVVNTLQVSLMSSDGLGLPVR
jgi:hypothetical protein